jgi:hypothetical protein
VPWSPPIELGACVGLSCSVSWYPVEGARALAGYGASQRK